MNHIITIKEYLDQQGIKYKESNGELITDCVFCHKPNHLYFNMQTSQYDCKVCGEQGNIMTLAKHLGDDLQSIYRNDKPVEVKKQIGVSQSLINECQQNLPERIRTYLNDRGLSNEIIDHFKFGYGEFYGRHWITLPIYNREGDSAFLKLRRDPADEGGPDKFKVYPSGSNTTIFGWENLDSNSDMVVICEGEYDRILLLQNGIPAITSTGGAGTFKKEWLEYLKELKRIYVCYDKDEAGIGGANKLIKMLGEHLSEAVIYKTTLPERMINGKDVTDYFNKYNGTPDELILSLSEQVGGRKPIDKTKFQHLSSCELVKVLGLTIKNDEENKLVSFLCELSAYTENSQFNISFNAPSSTGKSYIPTEVARLFPEEDIIEIGYCSPTAFFHDVGKLNKERGGYEIDLSRKILIFLDQPHTMLLERLRPLLSHDKKEMHLKITDKSQRGGLRTKNVFIKGYPSVVFCSAGLKIDEQEGTRFMLLSPEVNQEKIRAAIQEKIKKEADNNCYADWLNGNEDRALLKERIEAIREERIDDIKISNPADIEKIFLSKKSVLKPRHQRDIGRLMSLIKSFALLNLWFRKREGNVIIAEQEDINEAVRIWEKISESQEYNLPPYIFNLYKDVIVPAYRERNMDEHGFPMSYRQGVTRQDIYNKHFNVYGRMIEDFRFRQQVVPMLETAGLISQEPDPADKRKILIYPNVESV